MICPIIVALSSSVHQAAGEGDVGSGGWRQRHGLGQRSAAKAGILVYLKVEGRT